MLSTLNDRNVLIIGAGVIGLTTALCLRKKGFNVTITAEHFAPELTSVVAGALWEWPPAVCGYHHDQISLERSKEWCMVSYRIFEKLVTDKESGVFIRPVNFYFKYHIDDNPEALHKMNEIKTYVPGFYRGKDLLNKEWVNHNIGLKDAYQHLAPMVDTDVYMQWLMNKVKLAGCKIIQRKICGNLQENETALLKEFNVDAIVNCAGLGSAELSGEPMYPLRGALVRVINDGKTIPHINEAYCVSHDESKNEQDIVFIVPRGDNMLVLGGIAEKDVWEKNINLKNYTPIRNMYNRCVEFLSILKHATIDSNEPVRVGLRPFRAGNVRLEAIPGTHIIHNYGHGGAGVTFSWGCAEETSTMLNKMLMQKQSNLLDKFGFLSSYKLKENDLLNQKNPKREIINNRI
jgi:D-amino-acid oxidase